MLIPFTRVTRPCPGTAGRVVVNMDTWSVWEDTGEEWRELSEEERRQPHVVALIKEHRRILRQWVP